VDYPKTAESIEMPSGERTPVNPTNHVLGAVYDDGAVIQHSVVPKDNSA